MKLTNAQIILVAEAMLSLDGTPENPSKFSAKFRYALMKNVRLLQQRVRDIEKARIAIISELAPAGSMKIEKGAPEQLEFSKRYQSLLDTEVEVANFIGIKLSDLNLEVNQIPVQVLNNLGPVLVEDVDFS